MKTSKSRIISGILLAAMAGLSVTACSSRTYVTERTPVVVGDTAPATVVVPDRDPDVIIVDD